MELNQLLNQAYEGVVIKPLEKVYVWAEEKSANHVLLAQVATTMKNHIFPNLATNEVKANIKKINSITPTPQGDGTAKDDVKQTAKKVVLLAAAFATVYWTASLTVAALAVSKWSFVLISLTTLGALTWNNSPEHIKKINAES